MRVLIVDDEQAFAEPLAQRLELRGIEAAVAGDAETALGMLSRQEWDLVLAGAYEGDFAALLESSATFARHLGEIEAVWIEADTHPLATEVTRRDSALLATAREFFVAATLVEQGRLE